MPGKSQHNPYYILLIEDNDEDIKLIQEAFNEISTPSKLEVIKHGAEALEILHKKEESDDHQTPDLIILDLTLKNDINGMEILRHIKNDDALKKIPVIIFSMSSAQKDIDESYKLNANCYISKPIQFDKLLKIIKEIENFWFGLVKLPTRI